MSNALSIAAVTAVLKDLLDNGLVKDAPRQIGKIWCYRKHRNKFCTTLRHTCGNGILFTKLGVMLCKSKLNAAFVAADAFELVQMKHLLRAAQSEYAKLEKALTEAEIGGWV